jgi:hypothetical protein
MFRGSIARQITVALAACAQAAPLSTNARRIVRYVDFFFSFRCYFPPSLFFAEQPRPQKCQKSTLFCCSDPHLNLKHHN